MEDEAEQIRQQQVSQLREFGVGELVWWQLTNAEQRTLHSSERDADDVTFLSCQMAPWPRSSRCSTRTVGTWNGHARPSMPVAFQRHVCGPLPHLDWPLGVPHRLACSCFRWPKQSPRDPFPGQLSVAQRSRRDPPPQRWQCRRPGHLLSLRPLKPPPQPRGHHEGQSLRHGKSRAAAPTARVRSAPIVPLRSLGLVSCGIKAALRPPALRRARALPRAPEAPQGPPQGPRMGPLLAKVRPSAPMRTAVVLSTAAAAAAAVAAMSVGAKSGSWVSV